MGPAPAARQSYSHRVIWNPITSIQPGGLLIRSKNDCHRLSSSKFENRWPQTIFLFRWGWPRKSRPNKFPEAVDDGVPSQQECRPLH
jgi:hypothetical protein